MARRQISEERKATYYIGMVLMVLGFLTFISCFFSAPSVSNTSFGEFEQQSNAAGARAVTGIVIIVVGAIMMGIGRQGLAGSGVILDPEKAREDLEPWARMAGGIVKDGADEAGINLGVPFGHKDDSAEMPFDEKLRRLHQLHVDGVISNEEYEAEKRKILDEA